MKQPHDRWPGTVVITTKLNIYLMKSRNLTANYQTYFNTFAERMYSSDEDNCVERD